MKCKNCTVIIDDKKKFCSKSCATSYNNMQKVKTFINCLECKKEIRVYPNQVFSRKFCCKICSSNYRQSSNFNRRSLLIEKGEMVSNHIESNNQMYRRYLIKMYGNTCVKCGWGEVNQYTKNVPIEMHHIDGNSSNTCLENLQLLCPNCHSLTSTHKGANRTVSGSARYKIWKEACKS